MAFTVSKTSQSQAQYPSAPLRKTCARLESLPCRTVWRFGARLHTESTWRFETYPTHTPANRPYIQHAVIRRGACVPASRQRPNIGKPGKAARPLAHFCAQSTYNAPRTGFRGISGQPVWSFGILPRRTALNSTLSVRPG